MNHQEIERKFLVKNDQWRGGSAGVRYRQGYIACTGNRTVRVRIAGERGLLTIKYGGEGITRNEFEYDIPHEDAHALLNALNPCEIIEKTRYTFEENGNIWEIDEFSGANSGLIVAEIELSEARQTFVRPSWLGDEVSNIPRYFNVALAKFPYILWSEEQKKNKNA